MLETVCAHISFTFPRLSISELIEIWSVVSFSVSKSTTEALDSGDANRGGGRGDDGDANRGG